ncbi:MAG: HepT-like ribonuclease domain-containing protein [Pirellulales bacterium]
MTQHDPEIRIRHMRDHALEAIEMLGDTTLDELRNDRKLQLALVQLIEIVGEAASRIPEDVRKAQPSVPWQMAADMRNKLIHGYDVIEYAVVYDTVKDDLPPLVQQLDAILP